MFDLETPIALQIGRDDPNQDVAVAGHQVAFDDLRQFSHCFHEEISDRAQVSTDDVALRALLGFLPNN